MAIHVSNCRTEYHAGCAAVTQSMRSILERAGLPIGTIARRVHPRNLSRGDVLICNGEGTMHDTRGQAISLLEDLRQAKRIGCRTYLVNSVWQDMTEGSGRFLAELDGVAVREPLSRMEMLAFCDPQVYLDLAYYCPLSEVTPTDYHGECLVGDFFFRPRTEVMAGCPRLTLRDTDWSHLVASLSTARVYVTGRHHGVYAACRARTPFVFHRANTHKVTGLIAWSNVPLPVCPDTGCLADAANWALQHRDLYERFFDWMEQRPRWTPDDLLP